MKRISIGMLSGMVAVVLMISACGTATTVTPAPGATPAPAPVPSTPKVPREIIAAYDRDFTSLDPATIPGSPDYQIGLNVYNGLVRYKFGTTEVEADLAEKWEVSPDGKVYTFTLRKNVVWHAGYGNFTSADVKYSLDRQKDPVTKSRYASSFALVDRIEAPDDFTVKIHLKQAYSGFLGAVLAHRPGFIVNQKAIETLGKSYPLNPIGTGPFAFESYTQGQQMVLVANDKYFRGAPEVRKITWKVVPNETVTSLALQKGEINFSITRGSQIYKGLKGKPGISMTETSVAGWHSLQINLSRPPFDNLLVRKAIAHAIDKELLVTSVGEGMAVVGHAVLPPILIGPTKDLPLYNFDPAKSKSLLQQSAVAMPIKMKLMLRNNGDDINIATALQKWLKDVGIDMQIDVLETGAYQARRLTADYDAVVESMSRSEADQIANELLNSKSVPPGANIMRYKGVDDLILAQAAAIDPAKRKEVLDQMNRKVAEDLPVIILWYPTYVTSYRDFITNVAPNTHHWMTQFEYVKFKD